MSPKTVGRRRFPRPWDIEEINKAAFIVRDNNGTALAFVYCEDEPGRRAAASLLTRDGAADCGQHREAARFAWCRAEAMRTRWCKSDSLKGGTRRARVSLLGQSKVGAAREPRPYCHSPIT